MIRAYYTATNGAISNQNYIDVISNNMANMQTEGYQRSKAEFADLMYTNMHAEQGAQSNLKVGSGARLDKIDVVFAQSAPVYTGAITDFAIEGEGFFGVQIDDLTYYTRGGSFDKINIDGEKYLMYQGGYVLDSNEEPIIITDEDERIDVGVFTVENNSTLQRNGSNLFELTDTEAEVTLSENGRLLPGYVEASGVDMVTEMTKIIEIQRAFQMNSKIIQVADEIEQAINSLRS